MTSKQLSKFCVLDEPGKGLLRIAMETWACPPTTTALPFIALASGSLTG